jgi:hypothetical protein
MQYDEYIRLYNGLNTLSDIEKFSEEGYDSRLLDTLYTQKVSRYVKRHFHEVKSRSKSMLRQWKKGRTFLEIADYYSFPPILIMMMITQEDGIPKKKFWEIIRDPDQLEDSETAKEVREAVANDIVYSPAANERQKERGLWGEDLMHKWLDGQGIAYKTENDIREEGGSTKTPDCLLKEPVMYDGKKVFWFESKAAFGDTVEFRFNSRKQLIPYTELFGPGVVVYWTGYLEGVECPKDVYIDDIGIMEKKLGKIESE